MWGGILKYDLIPNLLPSLAVREFWEKVNIWQSYGKEYSSTPIPETELKSNHFLFD